MARFWNKNDLTLSCCATLIGCKPNAGMVNRFNDLQRAGAFANCEMIGDYLRVWTEALCKDAAENFPARSCFGLDEMKC